jgi:hypothetical protein
LKGLNIKKSTLAGMMSDEIKAKAYVENGWRQFTCGRLPWHNFGSHAVGLMQLIPPKAGYTDQELQWDEKQNLKCGTEYHDSLKKRAADKMKNAPSGDPPDMGDPPVPTSRADAELLEAIAKYMCPRDGYWAPFDKDNPQWVRNSGGQSGYADKVLSVMKHQVWDNDFVYKASGKDPETLKALPECPCSCGGQ